MEITVKIEKTAGTVSIEGESVLDGHANELEAMAIRDLVQAPTGSARANISEIFLTRHRDKASPKLAQACSTGENIGTVTIYLFKNVNGGPKAYMTYELTDTFVSRIEHETAEANGGAYLPHQGFSGTAGNVWGALWRGAGLNQNADRGYSRARAQPRPIYAMPPGAATDNEVERIWLSPATIKWTYTPYDSTGAAGGNVEKGWNLQTGIAV